jgi:predicted metalloprotease
MPSTTDPTRRTNPVKSATEIARAAQRKLVPLAVALCVAIGGITFGVTSIVGAHDAPRASSGANGHGTDHRDDHRGGHGDTDTGDDTGRTDTSADQSAGDVIERNPRVNADELDHLLVDIAAPDIEGYWAQTLAAVYNVDYQPLWKVVPYDPGVDRVTCQGQDVSNEDDAFFCPDGFVAYDRGYFANIASEHGAAATVFALAHEIGHSVEEQLLDVTTMATIENELRADCLAGAWAGDAADRGQITRDDLDAAVDLMTEVADPAGTPVDDDGAHGNKRERIDAFNQGLDNGPQACIE